MHKQELVDRLAKFAEAKHRVCPAVTYQVTFARFLIHYFTELEIPHDKMYDFYRIEQDLVEILIDAFEKLRTSNEPQIAQYRRACEKATGRKLVELMNIGASDGLERVVHIDEISELIEKVTGSKNISRHFKKYCDAQRTVVQQTFDRFLRQVARQGMREMVEKSTSAVMAGQFGDTRLEIVTGLGAIQFVFARENAMVGFTGDSDDPLCLGVNFQFAYTDMHTALDMVEDVIKRWPATTPERKKVFKDDKQRVFGNTKTTSKKAAQAKSS